MDPRRASQLASRAFYLSLAGVFLAHSESIAAQTHDPAPVRVGIESYGERSGSNDSELSVHIDASGQDAAAILVAGGAEGQFGFLLIGAEKASVRGPFDTHFLVEPLVIVPLGRFGVVGTLLRLPIDLVQMAPSVAYVQALSIPGDVSSASLSAGLGVRFAAGSVQPKLDYAGPASSAVLLAYDAAGEVPRHQVLHSVVVPTSGFTLEEAGRTSEGGVTRILMTLHETGNAAQVIETKRSLIDLGSSADPVIEIWIRQTFEGLPSPSPFERAARIERDF